MSLTLACDVYGTLIDTHGVVLKLKEIIGAEAGEFSRTWRGKQLEYSFRCRLMQKYENFAVCTSHALDYTCSYYRTSITNDQKHELLECYRTLPAFRDVKDGLAGLKAANYRLYAFSNGSADAVETLLLAAGIRDFFIDIVSVDDIKTFKPNPAVYIHFLRKSGASVGNAWLISSNPFDVIGAISTGMRAAWVQRSRDSIFDPWGIEPTVTIGSLGELYDKIG
jgi:2-haloacid dehalogenase